MNDRSDHKRIMRVPFCCSNLL